MDINEWSRLLEDLAAAGYNAADEATRVTILARLGLTPHQWGAKLATVEGLTRRGQILARFVTVYGLPAHLSPADLFALHLSVPFARGLRTLAGIEVSEIERGGTGQWHTYLAAADGDAVKAQRLADTATTLSGARSL